MVPLLIPVCDTNLEADRQPPGKPGKVQPDIETDAKAERRKDQVEQKRRPRSFLPTQEVVADDRKIHGHEPDKRSEVDNFRSFAKLQKRSPIK